MNRLMKLVKALIFVWTILTCGEIAYAQENDTVTAYEECVELYNMDNEVVAYYYELETGGYAIVSVDGDEFIEYSYDEDRYCVEREKVYYYTGPLGLFFKVSEDEMQNCANMEVMDINSLQFTLDGTDKGEHWVVGTGYRTVKLSGVAFNTVIVNDGWGNVNVVINMSYVDGCIYIK